MLHAENTGANPEVFHGGWLSGWLPALYYTEPWGWMASNDRPIPIVYSLQTSNGINPPPPLDQPLHEKACFSMCNFIKPKATCDEKAYMGLV